MQEKSFLTSIKKCKVGQLCVLTAIEIAFILLLISNPALCKHLFSNRYLFTLCLFVWILMLFNLSVLIYDLVKLRSIALEGHALKQDAYYDRLTGLLNRNGLDKAFQNYKNADDIAHVGIFMATLDNLKELNKLSGHAVGDVLVQNFSHILEAAAEGIGIVGRNGSNAYVMLVNNCTPDTMEAFREKLTGKIADYNATYPSTPISVRHACTINDNNEFEDVFSILTATYHKLFNI